MATASNIATSAERSAPKSVGYKTIARAGITVGALLAAAVLVSSSLADWASVDHPRIAAEIAPWNATAAANAAAALKNPRSPKARALVRGALARDATEVPAIELRALDLALSGKTTEARRLFELSNELSRRSLPTRLWLIQDSVDHGDVAGALRNFDIALRTTTDAQPILFPVLAKASADATLTMPLARTLDRKSDWRLTFLEWVLTNGGQVDGIAKVVAQMNDRRFIVGNGIDQQLIERLAADGQFGAANLLNRRFGHPAEGVADSNFANPSAHYPFGWGLVSDGMLTAERAISGSTSMLKYSAAPARSGQVAAQLLMLQPGRYALKTRTAAQAQGAAPYWNVTCAGEDGAQLAELDQPLDAGAQARTGFTVPAGCTAQWLTLRIRPSPDATPQSGAIASVAMSAG
jgi:hypothetical protein